jgi:DNA invertase Pin-like site-specific DNA recombinase
MKAAIYARYSTELQSADSIKDQIRVCERLAARHGFEVVERFSDAAITGGTAQRPGYQALLAAARAKRFKVILAEDTSRLWRSLPEQWRAVAELLDAGVHIVTQDIDTRSENFKILLSVHGAMADVYRDQIAYRTRRGLEGRARNGKTTGGRAYGYIAARDSASGEREVDPEAAAVVAEIFERYASGQSPRKIAGELNARGVPSPGSSWNRGSVRLNSKRTRGWVATAIHGDRKRGSGILNNRIYVGELVWNRSTWKRSAADSKLRRWEANDAAQFVTVKDERLRIISDELWQRVKDRQGAVEQASVAIRGALKRNGRLPRYVLSGLLYCEQCGGSMRNVNAREYGCASHRDGGAAACNNGLRVPIELAEHRLLDETAAEMLSDEGIAFLEREVRRHLREQADKPKPVPKPQAEQIARKRAEVEQLRALMKNGTLSQTVAVAAIAKAEEEVAALEQVQPAADEKNGARVIRMLPQAARVLRQRISRGNLGFRDPRSIVQARNVLFSMFGGRVAVRPAQVKDGERPYLIARVALNRNVLIEAAMSCVKSGSGGTLPLSHTIDPKEEYIALR